MAFSRKMNGVDHQADNTTSICRLVFSCSVQFRTLNVRYIRVKALAPFSWADFSHALSVIAEHAHQFFSAVQHGLCQVVLFWLLGYIYGYNFVSGMDCDSLLINLIYFVFKIVVVWDCFNNQK